MLDSSKCSYEPPQQPHDVEYHFLDLNHGHFGTSVGHIGQLHVYEHLPSPVIGVRCTCFLIKHVLDQVNEGLRYSGDEYSHST
jgi:hypothetical protein